MGNAELNCSQCEMFQIEPSSFLTDTKPQTPQKDPRYSIAYNSSKSNQISESHLIQNDQPHQTGDKCEKILLQGQIYYEGSVVNGKRQGKGRQVWPDGSFYDGEWKNDMANGKGVFSMQNGGRYEGDFKNDKFDGMGKYVSAGQQLIYQGQYVQHHQHGMGTEISYTQKYRYIGNFKCDLKDGQGEIQYQNGISYKGLWKNGKFDGEGHYVSPVLEYNGGWKENTMHGYGSAKWKNNSFQGQYIMGKKQGHGVYTFSDGKKYIGQWLSGAQHGYGQIHYPNGTIKRGRWINGKEDHSFVTN